MSRIKPGWIIAAILCVLALLIGARMVRAPAGGRTTAETAGPTAAPFTAPPAPSLVASATLTPPASPPPVARTLTQSSAVAPPVPSPAIPTVFESSPAAQIRPTPAPSGATATAVPVTSTIPHSPPETIVPPGGPDAATNLHAEVECSVSQPQHGSARLNWTVASRAGSQQRVDVTIYSFEDQQFETSGPLPPDQSSLVWERVHGQAVHFWRVLTRHGDQWVSSEIQTFEGPPCMVDYGQPTITPSP